MGQDMRIKVTKRMLREGMLRCLQDTTLSKITVSALCREAGVNRATFYNHYSVPADILRELAREYAWEMHEIYRANARRGGGGDEAGLEKCLDYLYQRKEEIKLLFSKNAEHCLTGYSMEIISEGLDHSRRRELRESDADDFLLTVAISSAVYGLLEAWLTLDIDRTPAQLVGIIKLALRREMLEKRI